MAKDNTRDEASDGRGSSTVVTLDQLCSGELAEVVEVNDRDVRTQTMRLGICGGAMVSCVTRIPAGPIVLRHGLQEIALGRALAKKISIRKHPINAGREIKVDSRASS